MNSARPRGWLRFLLVFWAVGGLSFTVRAADEDALLALWKQHIGTPDNHEAAFKACRDFATTHPGDPLLPMVRGLEAWHLLRAGRRGEAMQIMAADLTAPPGPVTDGARRVAQGWMTRGDRDQAAAALQAYYRKNVAYPKTLEQLPADGRPPLNDRFGKPWNYKLTGLAKVPGFDDQKYSLQSAVLGGLSDFKEALALPYAAGIAAVPQQVITAPGNNQVVKFNVAGTSVLLGVGQSTDNLHLAFAGTKILLVCDATHWKILPRP
ncbi:MAG: hypothetical protein WCQ16_00975 [Verrucomicrobiae bacterium]